MSTESRVSVQVYKRSEDPIPVIAADRSNNDGSSVLENLANRIVFDVDHGCFWPFKPKFLAHAKYRTLFEARNALVCSSEGTKQNDCETSREAP